MLAEIRSAPTINVVKSDSPTNPTRPMCLSAGGKVLSNAVKNIAMTVNINAALAGKTSVAMPEFKFIHNCADSGSDMYIDTPAIAEYAALLADGFKIEGSRDLRTRIMQR